MVLPFKMLMNICYAIESSQADFHFAKTCFHELFPSLRTIESMKHSIVLCLSKGVKRWGKYFLSRGSMSECKQEMFI